MTKYIALFCIFYSLPVYADNNSVYLKQGQAAPYEGVLLDTSRAQRVLEMQYDLNTCNTISKLKDDENNIVMTRLNNAQAEEDRLASQVNKDKSDSFWTKTAYFALGAVLTGAIAYGATRAVR